VRYRPRAYTQVLSHHPPETRYIRASSLVKFAHFGTTRISKTNPTRSLDPWFIMTNLPKSWQLELGKRYSFEVGLSMALSR